MRTKINTWLHKYVLVGQQLYKSAAIVDENAPFYVRHRRLLSMSLPALLVEIIWLAYMIDQNRMHLFNGNIGEHDSPRWYATVTMIFGSIVAGATSEGGGAIG